jgi:hypothetical protein
MGDSKGGRRRVLGLRLLAIAYMSSNCSFASTGPICVLWLNLCLFRLNLCPFALNLCLFRLNLCLLKVQDIVLYIKFQEEH